MKSERLKTRLIGQMLLIAFLVGITSCQSFNWDADFYAPDHETGSIYSVRGDEVSCLSEEIEGFACLPLENVEELLLEIKRLEKKLKKQRQSPFQPI